MYSSGREDAAYSPAAGKSSSSSHVTSGRPYITPRGVSALYPAQEKPLSERGWGGVVLKALISFAVVGEIRAEKRSR